MKKIILTSLLVLSFNSISNEVEKFKLEKPNLSNTYISQITNQKSSAQDKYSFCPDECYDEFDQCIDNGVNEYYCEDELQWCLGWCDYAYN